MSELSKREQAWLNRFNQGIPEGCQLTPGWPDAEYGITYEAYIEYVTEEFFDTVAELDEGNDMLPVSFHTFRNWVETRREEVRQAEESNDFQWQHCDLCGAQPGNRHPVTAWKGPDDPNYYALSVCDDCLCYLANGDFPNLED